jgi:hypothetical protein
VIQQHGARFQQQRFESWAEHIVASTGEQLRGLSEFRSEQQLIEACAIADQ